MRFEWDERKAVGNLAKHGISFHEAATVFHDPLAMTYIDPDHSQREDRFLTFGRSDSGHCLVVAHMDRQATRIISARRMTRRERRQYEQAP
ncbi:MAG: BrnT family toxin [Phycisphaeraceae bacterium]|nr:BrnT family toxin [Phycisphaeraceae bacterium]